MTTLEQIDVKTSLINRLQEYARALKDYDLACDILGAIELLEQQQEQEPVLWGCKFNKGNRLDTFYTKGAAERFVEGSLRNGADVSLVGLYAEPPQRRALTRDQALKIVAANPDVMTAIRMTEAAHGVKELNA